MFPCLPLLGQCCFGVFLPAIYLVLCHLSSYVDKTVGWADNWEMVRSNFSSYFNPNPAHWQNWGGRVEEKLCKPALLLKRFCGMFWSCCCHSEKALCGILCSDKWKKFLGECVRQAPLGWAEAVISRHFIQPLIHGSKLQRQQTVVTVLL